MPDAERYPNGELIEDSGVDVPDASPAIRGRALSLKNAFRLLVVTLAYSGDPDIKNGVDNAVEDAAVALRQPLPPRNPERVPEPQQLDCEPTPDIRLRRKKAAKAA